MKSYLRFLGRNKRYTAIQVVGLSVSLAFVIILTSWLVNIVKMGRENPEYEDIYAVCYQNSMHTTWALGEHLSDNIPEIECTSTMLLYPGHFTLKNADCVKINWCEENFFEFFPREFIAGDASFLKVPSEVGISETFANTYFPAGDAIGKTVTLLDKDYIITAIYKDFGDGLIKYNDMIMAMSARGEKNFSIPSQEMLSGMVTMIKLKDGVDIGETEKKIKEETIKHYTIASEKYIEAASSAQNNEAYIKMIKSRLADETCRLVRYDEITYDEANQYFTVNTKFTIRIIVIIVVLLLITALMNYVNLNVALAGKRAKEAATKNLLGSQKSSVYLQFFKEAFAVTVFCTLLGVCLAVVSLPSINSMLQGYDGLGSRFSISFEPMTVGAVLGILIMTSILSGCVPAYYVSRFSALDVTKGSFRFNRKTILNKVFICIQTILATAFITFSIILQVGYDNMINIDSGCDHDDLFYLLPSDRLEPESNCFTHYDALQSELLTHPEIESVDYTNGTVFNCRTFGVPLDENFNQIIDAHMIYCTPEAFDIYGFKVISKNDNAQYGMWMTESFKKIFDNSQYLQQIMLDPSGDFGFVGVIEDYPSSGIPVFGDAKTPGYVNVFTKQYVNDYNNLVFGNDKASKENLSTFTLTEATTYPFTVTSAGMATLCLPFNVVMADGMYAYDLALEGIKQEGNDEVYDCTMIAIAGPGQTLKAGTPVIIGANKGDYDLAITMDNNGSGTSLNGSLLKGNFVKQDLTQSGDKVKFIFANGNKGVGFYRLSSGTSTLGANKCWLEWDVPTMGDPAQSIRLRFEDVTDITSVIQTTKAEGIYDLTGRRLAAPQKGVNIINGKKVIL